MPTVNHATRIITSKLVYFGPGRSGKSSNLNYLYSALPAEEIGELTSFATRRDRTLEFEYTPTDLGAVGPYQMRFEICTVPGQSYFHAAREDVLKGADGIAFIADSRLTSLDENISCLQDLHTILAAQGVSGRSLPFVFQYNKQNLPADEIATIGELSAALNFRHAPEYGANARQGDGVIETLRSLGTQLLKHLGVATASESKLKSTEIDFDNMNFEMEHFQTPRNEAAA